MPHVPRKLNSPNLLHRLQPKVPLDVNSVGLKAVQAEHTVARDIKTVVWSRPMVNCFHREGLRSKVAKSRAVLM